MKSILLVDDEERMLDVLSLYLTPHNYQCVKLNSGKTALDYVMNNKVNLIILDVMMPEMDGWTTCKKIREVSEVPIMMLSGKTEKDDIVKGLNYGADEYLTKPFNVNELLARIEALLRRVPKAEANKIYFHNLVWDEEAFELSYKFMSIPLTLKEFLLVGLFLKNQNKVFSREHLLLTIWGNNSGTDNRTIDSHIRNIRDKIRQAGFPIDDYLKTKWGVGYKWVIEENN